MLWKFALSLCEKDDSVVLRYHFTTDVIKIDRICILLFCKINEADFVHIIKNPFVDATLLPLNGVPTPPFAVFRCAMKEKCI